MVLIIAGWPKVVVMTLSKEKVIIILATALCSNICPILISCGIYAAMIFIKKRKFANKVGATTLENNASANLNSNQRNLQGINIKEQNNDSDKNSSERENNFSNFLQDHADNFDAQEVTVIHKYLLMTQHLLRQYSIG